MKSRLNVVILGGGTAGWMCGAALASVLKAARPDGLCSIRLIESSEIATVGVGEATLPHIKTFNDLIGIDEADFMCKTHATFKLGIEFVGWGRESDSYIHPFGTFGQPFAGVEFQHYWTRGRQIGLDARLEQYSYAVMAARGRKFDFPSEDLASIKSTYSYAYHFDAALYADYLRAFSEARGLVRTEGKVVHVETDAESGDIRSLMLESGEVVAGDLFIDCSGFRGLLIDGSQKVAWQDWSAWLPCDRALAVPSRLAGELLPFTRATALEAGWQWRIPLQHRTGNGYVYSSAFISDEAAAERLMGNLDGAALADPKPLRFRAGRRVASWSRNCIAIGLAGGFLEPLESTSIYLVQVAITNLLDLFPAKRIDHHLRTEFNRLVDDEYDRVRDFLILHYHANARSKGELWTYTREMAVPDSLSTKLEQFRRRGYLMRHSHGLFSSDSWLAVLAGQSVLPRGYHRLADHMDTATLTEHLNRLRERIGSTVGSMPSHEAFIQDYCSLGGASPPAPGFVPESVAQ